MTTIILEVQDKNLKFFKDLIKHLSFVKIKEEHLDEDTDEQVIENIRQGIKEMRLVEQEKAKSRPAREFLDEL